MATNQFEEHETLGPHADALLFSGVRIRRVPEASEARDNRPSDSSHATESRYLDTSKLPVYEVMHASNRSGESPSIHCTDSPDVALISAGCTLRQASLLIHRADWQWAHDNPDWVVAAQVTGIDSDDPP